jgi:hypothetical protein
MGEKQLGNKWIAYQQLNGSAKAATRFSDLSFG